MHSLNVSWNSREGINDPELLLLLLLLLFFFGYLISIGICFHLGHVYCDRDCSDMILLQHDNMQFPGDISFIHFKIYFFRKSESCNVLSIIYGTVAKFVLILINFYSPLILSEKLRFCDF